MTGSNPNISVVETAERQQNLTVFVMPPSRTPEENKLLLASAKMVHDCVQSQQRSNFGSQGNRTEIVRPKNQFRRVAHPAPDGGTALPRTHLPATASIVSFGDHNRVMDVQDVSRYPTPVAEHLRQAMATISNGIAAANDVSNGNVPEHFSLATPETILLGLRSLENPNFNSLDDITNFFGGNNDAVDQLAAEEEIHIKEQGITSEIKTEREQLLLQRIDKYVNVDKIFLRALSYQHLMLLINNCLLSNAIQDDHSLVFPASIPDALTDSEIREIFGEQVTRNAVVDELTKDARNRQLLQTPYTVSQFTQVIDILFWKLFPTDCHLPKAQQTTQLTERVKKQTTLYLYEMLGVNVHLKTVEQKSLAGPTPTKATFRLNSAASSLMDRPQTNKLAAKCRDNRSLNGQKAAAITHTFSAEPALVSATGTTKANKTALTSPETSLRKHIAGDCTSANYSTHTNLPITPFISDNAIALNCIEARGLLTRFVTNIIEIDGNEPKKLLRRIEHPWVNNQGERFTAAGKPMDKSHPEYYLGLDIELEQNSHVFDSVVEADLRDISEYKKRNAVTARAKESHGKGWKIFAYDAENKQYFLQKKGMFLRVTLDSIVSQLAKLRGYSTNDHQTAGVIDHIRQLATELAVDKFSAAISNNGQDATGDIATPRLRQWRGAGLWQKAINPVQSTAPKILASGKTPSDAVIEIMDKYNQISAEPLRKMKHTGEATSLIITLSNNPNASAERVITLCKETLAGLKQAKPGTNAGAGSRDAASQAAEFNDDGTFATVLNIICDYYTSRQQASLSSLNTIGEKHLQALKTASRASMIPPAAGAGNCEYDSGNNSFDDAASSATFISYRKY